MKYLVQKETKVHQVIPDDFDFEVQTGLLHWDIVQADSEGWIPWSGGECPLPDNCPYQIKTILGKLFDAQFCPQENQYWGGRSILHYRPILTEQSEPNLFEHLVFDKNPETVFDRLQSAVRASSEIPSIIEEINALLPSGYVVVKTESIEAQPVEDMSDWRNWRPGDILTFVKKSSRFYTKGNEYEITGYGRPCDDFEFTDDDCGKHYWDGSDAAKRFRFHSRPTGASK